MPQTKKKWYPKKKNLPQQNISRNDTNIASVPNVHSITTTSIDLETNPGYHSITKIDSADFVFFVKTLRELDEIKKKYSDLQQHHHVLRSSYETLQQDYSAERKKMRKLIDLYVSQENISSQNVAKLSYNTNKGILDIYHSTKNKQEISLTADKTTITDFNATQAEIDLQDQSTMTDPNIVEEEIDLQDNATRLINTKLKLFLMNHLDFSSNEIKLFLMNHLNLSSNEIKLFLMNNLNLSSNDKSKYSDPKLKITT